MRAWLPWVYPQFLDPLSSAYLMRSMYSGSSHGYLGWPCFQGWCFELASEAERGPILGSKDERLLAKKRFPLGFPSNLSRCPEDSVSPRNRHVACLRLDVAEVLGLRSFLYDADAEEGIQWPNIFDARREFLWQAEVPT